LEWVHPKPIAKVIKEKMESKGSPAYLKDILENEE